MELADSLILAGFSAMVGFGLSHFQSDDRYVVLNKGKYQLESTGTVLSFFAMTVCAGFSAGATFIFVLDAIFSKHERFENYIGPILCFLALSVLTGLLAIRSARSYNPYCTFVKIDNEYYRILELSDAGYLLSHVSLATEVVSMSDFVVCKPITVLAEQGCKLLAIRKKDFEKMSAASFSSAFEE